MLEVEVDGPQRRSCRLSLGSARVHIYKHIQSLAVQVPAKAPKIVKYFHLRVAKRTHVKIQYQVHEVLAQKIDHVRQLIVCVTRKRSGSFGCPMDKAHSPFWRQFQTRHQHECRNTCLFHVGLGTWPDMSVLWTVGIPPGRNWCHSGV